MTTTAKRDPYKGQNPRTIPAYDAGTVARYLRIPEKTIRHWACGRPLPSGKHSDALITLDDPNEVFFSFANLIELHVLGALRREHDVKLLKIRRAIEYLQRELDSPRPLLERTMETDGVDVFVEHLGDLLNASKQGQRAMREMMQGCLKRIDRDAHGVPIRLFPFTRPTDAKTATADAPRLVSIDPAVAFGRAVIVGSRVPTREVYERYMRGESNQSLADDFGRSVAEIEEAVRCESSAEAA